jgi:thiol-disulfide isomerase/thioredoxin
MKSKHWIVTLLLSMSVFGGVPSSQQSADGMALLKRVSATYRGLESYEIRAMVTSDQRWEEARTLTEIPLVMAEDKPGKFRLESKQPVMGAMEVSDGKTTWQYIAMGHQYTKKPAGEGSAVAENIPFMPTNYVKRYRQVAEKATRAQLLREETLPLEGKQVPCAVIEVEFASDPDGKKKQEPPHTLWVDKERALVLEDVWEKTTNTMGISSQTRTIVVYKAIHIGRPVPDSLFSFTPPANAKEIDELAVLGASAHDLPKGPGPEFTLSTLEGTKTSLSDFKGKVVLLDFWATWCVPCRESTSLIERLDSAFSSKGLVTLAIDYGEEPAVVKGYLVHNPSSLRDLVDPDEKVADLYKVSSVPTFILISKNGKVTYISSGFGNDTEAGLRAALKTEGFE